MENSKECCKWRKKPRKYADQLNISDMKENSESTSIYGGKGVKGWHVVDNDEGSVQNLIDRKYLSFDKEEILISEQMTSDSKLINLAKSEEIENWNRNKVYAKVKSVCLYDGSSLKICGW